MAISPVRALKEGPDSFAGSPRVNDHRLVSHHGCEDDDSEEPDVES
jgi:hypothetical protein